MLFNKESLLVETKTMDQNCSLKNIGIIPQDPVKFLEFLVFFKS